MSVLGQDAVGGVPTVADAVLWRDELGLSMPVLADVEHTFYPLWDPADVLPMTYLIDQQGVVRAVETSGVGGLPALEQQVIDLLAGG